MRALITGVGGFVGGFLAKHLIESGDEVFGTIYSGNARAYALPLTEIKTFQIDLSDTAKTIDLVNSIKPDVIYHLAGIAFVPEAEENFDRVLRSNVLATSNVVRAAHLLGRPTKVVFVSSAEVYGKVSPDQIPISEGVPPQPANNYSLTKLMSEEVVHRYARGNTISAVIVRPFNHIGPRQDPRFVASSFARQVAQIKLGIVPPVMKVGNLEAKRDFSDVRDIVRAYRLSATKGSGIYNLGVGHSCAVRLILETLVKFVDQKISIESDPSRMRGPEVPEIYSDCSKAFKDLGWKTEIPLERSLRDTFDFWVDFESKARS